MAKRQLTEPLSTPSVEAARPHDCCQHQGCVVCTMATVHQHIAGSIQAPLATPSVEAAPQVCQCGHARASHGPKGGFGGLTFDDGCQVCIECYAFVAPRPDAAVEALTDEQIGELLYEAWDASGGGLYREMWTRLAATARAALTRRQQDAAVEALAIETAAKINGLLNEESYSVSACEQIIAAALTRRGGASEPKLQRCPCNPLQDHWCNHGT